MPDISQLGFGHVVYCLLGSTFASTNNNSLVKCSKHYTAPLSKMNMRLTRFCLRRTLWEDVASLEKIIAFRGSYFIRYNSIPGMHKLHA